MEIKEFNEGMENLTKDEILRIKAVEVTMGYYGRLALYELSKKTHSSSVGGMNCSNLDFQYIF